MKQRRIFVLGAALAVAIAFGLVHTDSAADEPERQGSSRPQPTTEDLILVEAERFRSDLWDIFSNYSNLAQTFGKSDRDPVIEQAIRSVNNLSNDDALFLLSSGVDLAPLLQQVQNVNAIVNAAPGGDADGQFSPLASTAGFPTANYSALCRSGRIDTDLAFGLQVALQLAKGVWSLASRGCDQVVVVCPAPGGGNTSLACTIADGILFVAEAAFDDAVTFCVGDIDSAEIEGSYERLEHLHDDFVCKFPDVVNVARSGHGCNGIDDNCDGQIDECGEDTFGPIVHIDQSVTKCCYDNAEDAAAAVALAASAWDMCANVTIGAPVVNGTECDVTVDVSANDDCSNATTVSTTVTIDGDGPSVSIDPAVADVCYASIDAAEQAVLDATTIMDNCNSLEDLQIIVHSSVEECALRVRLEVTDKCGNTSTAAVTVRVDPRIPSVDIQTLRLGFRGEVLAFQTPACYATIAEAQQAVLAITHSEDNCTNGPELVTSVSSAGDSCSLLVTTKAVDECGNENTDTETVRVDAEAPVVTCSVAIDTLFPPNLAETPVGFSFTAVDNCDSFAELDIDVKVTSDEQTTLPPGRGKASHFPDAAIQQTEDGTFADILLRNERGMLSDGRVYMIHVTATDQCGNVGHADCTVVVLSADDKPAVDNGQYYDATGIN